MCVGLRGRGDDEVFAEAQARQAVLVTQDKGFSNTVRFRPGKHAGITVLRVPNELPTARVNQELLRALEDLRGEGLTGLLIVVQVGRTRVRRPTKPT